VGVSAVSLVGETGVQGECHRPAANCQTITYSKGEEPIYT